MLLLGLGNLVGAFAGGARWETVLGVVIGVALIAVAAGILKRKSFAWPLGFTAIGLGTIYFVVSSLSFAVGKEGVERIVLLSSCVIGALLVRRLRRCRSPSRISTAAGQHAARRELAEPGELITAVTLPTPLAARRSTARCATGLRTRSRSSRSPRSCSATGTGRVALGGVAHKPWRVEAAEREMPRGAKPSPPRCSPARGPRTTTHSRSRWSSARSPRSSRKRRAEP